MKRREFITTSALAVAGTAAFPAFSLPVKYKIGLQLYTLRDVINKDPKGILKQVADLGYQELEAYGYDDGMLFGMTAKEFSNYAKSLGLRVTSGHYRFGRSEKAKTVKGSILNQWERAVADAKEVGQEYMVVAYLEQDERKTLDDYKFVCEKLNSGAEVCRSYGVTLNYHNHDFEFAKIENLVPYDLMLAELEPKLVSIEMDLYWVSLAGYKPVDYFKKYPGRFVQWHVKDMDKTDPKRNADIGTGSIDFKEIFTYAPLAGLKHYYMEQETYPKSSMESIKASIGYLKDL